MNESDLNAIEDEFSRKYLTQLAEILVEAGSARAARSELSDGARLWVLLPHESRERILARWKAWQIHKYDKACQNYNKMLADIEALNSAAWVESPPASSSNMPPSPPSPNILRRLPQLLKFLSRFRRAGGR